MDFSILYKDGAVANITVPKVQVNRILKNLIGTEPVRQINTTVEVVQGTTFVRTFVRDFANNWQTHAKLVATKRID